MSGILRRIACALLALAFVAQGARALTEHAQLLANDGLRNDRFGVEADISGDYAVVGAYRAGAAYIYYRCNGAWEQQAKLVPSDPETGSSFGWTVSISGDTAIVGAHDKSGPAGASVGAAYIFVRSGTTWTQQAKLAPADGEADNTFAWDVWIQGDTAICGSVHDDASGLTNAGSAYVYSRSNGTWTLQQKLYAPNPSISGEFGRSVNVYGNTMAIGASGWQGEDTGANRVYVYTRSGNTWNLQQQLAAVDSTGNDHYGIALMLSGETLLVGAEKKDGTGGQNSGGAYVYTRNNGFWSLQARLAPADVASADSFGFCVALSGDFAIIGAVYGDSPTQADTGAAYVYQRTGTTWSLLHKLNASDGRLGDQFANSVGISGDTALVTAVDDDTIRGSNSGSAYIFDVGLPAPVITSTYPIAGTAIPNAVVELYIVDPICGDKNLIATTASDSSGDFGDATDLSPYVGAYLTARAFAPDTRTSHESVPVLIELNCPVAGEPGDPVPADGATIANASINLQWTSVAQAAKASAAWEIGSDCASPLDLSTAIPPNQVQLQNWNGQSFASQGVTFSTTSPSNMNLVNSASSFEPPSLLLLPLAGAGPLNMHFDPPVACVSFTPLNTGMATLTAYDENDAVIAQLVNQELAYGVVDRIKLRAAGIKRVSYDTEAITVTGLQSLSFEQDPCAIRFDVYFGTTPLSLPLIYNDLPNVQCPMPALTPGTRYYWKVVAKGPRGDVEGPIWGFTYSALNAANDDAYALPQNAAPAVLDVLANDVLNLPRQILSFTQPSAGTLVLNANNTFTYTPPGDFVGPTSFTYTIPTASPADDPTATVRITLLAVNHAPYVARPLPDITVAMNSAPQAVNASLVFADPDGDTLSYTANSSNPALVTVAPSGTSFILTYAAGLSGTSTITIRATDPGNLFAEDTMLITVGSAPQPPQITQHPTNLTVNFGENASFTCAATSASLLSYRWQKNGSDLPITPDYSGVTSPQLTINAANNADEGTFRCRITDGTATVFTNVATLNVRDPYIAVQPQDTLGGVGGIAVFEVSALGTDPITYQWYIGNAALVEGAKYNGTQTARLTIRDLVDLPANSDEQLYHCRIKGIDPELRTRDALLTVRDPAILSGPDDLTVREGAPATFSVVAQGTPPLIYRWKRNGVQLSDTPNISGTQTAQLRIANAQESDEADYTCTVVGQEIAESRVARLTVTGAPNIIGIRVLPENGVAPRGGTFSIECLLDGPAAGVAFQWRKGSTTVSNSARISGATSALLTVSGALSSDAGTYFCDVIDGATVATSPPGAIRVGLNITLDLADKHAEVGQHLEWPVRVAGATGTQSYSWFRDAETKALEAIHDGPRYAGTETDTLIIDPVAFGDAGTYFVLVEDGLDNVSSRPALLTVTAQLPLLGVTGIAGLAVLLAMITARRARRGNA